LLDIQATANRVHKSDGITEKKDEIISLFKNIVEELQKANSHLSARKTYKRSFVLSKEKGASPA
jgi:hypothetical protein